MFWEKKGGKKGEKKGAKKGKRLKILSMCALLVPRQRDKSSGQLVLYI